MYLLKRLLLCTFCYASLFSYETTEDLIAQQDRLIAHVQTSIANGQQMISKLNQEALAIDGMSSPKVRHFLNNLCSLPEANYLEIGCWKGSTLVASLFGNQSSISSAVAIDNWSDFGGPKEEFDSNCQIFLSSYPCKFYEEDCFQIAPCSLCNNPINIYFYDVDHTSLAQ